MKLLFRVFIVVVAFYIVSSSKTYVFNRLYRGNWYKAYHYCYTHGMRLATIKSKEESDQVSKFLNETGIHQDFGYYWIGGTSTDNENFFYWMGHDEPMTFTNWYSTEPSNGNGEEHCVEIRTRLFSQWNDENCEKKKFFICERDE